VTPPSAVYWSDALVGTLCYLAGKRAGEILGSTVDTTEHKRLRPLGGAAEHQISIEKRHHY
jgi:hypothetical protein